MSKSLCLAAIILLTLGGTAAATAADVPALTLAVDAPLSSPAFTPVASRSGPCWATAYCQDGTTVLFCEAYGATTSCESQDAYCPANPNFIKQGYVWCYGSDSGIDVDYCPHCPNWCSGRNCGPDDPPDPA